MKPITPIDPGPNRSEMVYQSLEPTVVRDDADLQRLLSNYRRKIESDSRHILCDIQGKIVQNQIVLSGKVMCSNTIEGMEHLLEHRGWPVNRSQVEILPGPTLQGKR